MFRRNSQRFLKSQRRLKVAFRNSPEISLKITLGVTLNIHSGASLAIPPGLPLWNSPRVPPGIPPEIHSRIPPRVLLKSSPKFPKESISLLSIEYFIENYLKVPQRIPLKISFEVQFEIHRGKPAFEGEVSVEPISWPKFHILGTPPHFAEIRKNHSLATFHVRGIASRCSIFNFHGD